MLTTLALGVAGLLAVVLLTPLDLSIRCERRPVFRYRFDFRWLFGLVRTRIAPSEPSEAKEEPSRRRKPRKKAKPRRGRRRQHVGAMLMTRGFLSGGMRLLRRLVHAVSIRIPLLWLRAGFEDPADTGMVSAWMFPLSTRLAARGPGHFDIAPDFSGENLQFALESYIRLVPARLLWPLVVFGLSPSTLRGLYAFRTGR